MVRNPEAEQSKIAQYLNLAPRHSFQDCYANYKDKAIGDLEQLVFEMGGIHPLSTTSIGRWKQDKHKERIKEQLAASPEIVDLLIELGYEQDDEWTKDYI